MGYEDFTTYTKVDDGGTIDISAQQIEFGNATSRMYRGLHSYVYVDKGAGHFNGDLSHLIEFLYDNQSFGGRSSQWLISDSIGDVTQQVTADANFVHIFDIGGDFYLQTFEDGDAGDYDLWQGPSDTTKYYVTIDRDYDGGANSTGRFTVYIRTGSHTGTLVDTLTIDIGAGAQVDYQYVYGFCNYGSGTTQYLNGDVWNLDLQEAADYNIAKISGAAIATISKIFGIAIASINKIGGKNVLEE